MGRKRKALEEFGEVMRSPGSVQQLQDAIAALDLGDTSQWFFTIRRRHPDGEGLWSHWKRRIPVSGIDDIRDYCYKNGGEECDYRIGICDAGGKKPKAVNGDVFEERVLPALKKPEEIKAEQERKLNADDPMLADQFRDIQHRRRILELRRQEAEVYRQEAALQKRLRGDDDDDGEEEDETPTMPPWGSPYGYDPRNPYASPPWWMHQRHEKKDNSDKELLVELVKALRPPEPKKSMFEDLDFLKFFISQSKGKELDPKDMLSFVSPVVAEMTKMNGETSRMVLEKIIAMMEVTGTPEDEIEKWRKIANLVTETGGSVIKTIFGRPTIAKGDQVQVPVIKKLEAPAAPTGKPPEPQPQPNPAPEAPAKEEPKASEQEDLARGVAKQRVEAILTAQEQEMIVGSDPSWVAEKMDDAWMSLPGDLRKDLEGKKVNEVYDKLREFCPELVDRILEAVSANKEGTYKKWCLEFWDEMLHPPDDDGGDDDEDDEEPEPVVPDPAPEPEKEPEPVNES